MNIPPVIFQSDQRLSVEQTMRIKDAWRKFYKQVHLGVPAALVLDAGLKIVPLQNGPAVPDAFCRYCSVANLSTSVWCQGCGAPMIREV